MSCHLHAPASTTRVPTG